MVARRTGDDAALFFFVREVGELVVGATDLEAEDVLEILAFEIDLVLGAGREVDSVGEGCLLEDLVAASGEDQAQVVGVLLLG